MLSSVALTLSDGGVRAIILVSCFIGLLFAVFYTWISSKVKIGSDSDDSDKLLVQDGAGGANEAEIQEKVLNLNVIIRDGAKVFLYREYLYMAFFIVFFGAFVFVVVGIGMKEQCWDEGVLVCKEKLGSRSWVQGALTTFAFVLGSITSIVSGYVGMMIATYANARTALEARKGYGPAFVAAFRAGCVMGFALVSLGVLVLFIVVSILKEYYGDRAELMYEAVAGYGLGGSSIALFGRVGGGIYTKAADVGADLVGKLEYDLNEDDPKNPACIADNVGDNVGDVAGMGADLFGSFAESSCAAMVVASQSAQLSQSYAALAFPMVLIGLGTMVCLVTSFVATNLMVVKKRDEVEPSLKRQLLISTVLMTPTVYLVTELLLPEKFEIGTRSLIADLPNPMYKSDVKSWYIFFCVACGLWSGLAIGYITEYYTSNAYRPVKEVAASCETGAATNIIYGLALGYKSVIIPVICMAITIYTSFYLAGMFGIACAALGILSTLSIGLTIDAYGPICDNAGGIAEMAGMEEEVRERTDCLDAAGNTTAAIGKGFAIGSAAFVSLALFGGYVTALGPKRLRSVDILSPFPFAGLLVGAMLPYWFSAMTMKSVGMAALDMVKEVRRQFDEDEDVLLGRTPPDYAACVRISTDASLREMIAPGVLVMGTPLIVGFFFGVEALAGVLAGALVSGVQMAISSSNTGGAWDNAKKLIESGELGENKGKGSEEHKAAIVGDTVGDPLKDTSGPSLNILIKLMAVESLVFARSFPTESYLSKLFNSF